MGEVVRACEALESSEAASRGGRKECPVVEGGVLQEVTVSGAKEVAAAPAVGGFSAWVFFYTVRSQRKEEEAQC